MTEHITNSHCVKFAIGLRLARKGFRTAEEVARKLGISPEHYYNILACRFRPPKHQAAIAKLCGCDPHEIFGQFTHKSLRKNEASK